MLTSQHSILLESNNKEKRMKQIDRILSILSILSQGREISLATNVNSDKVMLVENNDEFEGVEVGLRTLQNDMRYIKNYLGDNLSKKGSSYKLIKKDSLDDFFKDNHTEIRKFFHAISLIDKSVFGDNFKKYAPILDSIQAQQKGVYLFLQNPFEELKQLDLKEKLEGYIQQRRYICIHYHAEKKYQFDKVQPFKIVYHSGNWYLAVITTQDYEFNQGFKLLRLNFIKDITVYKGKHSNFQEDLKIKGFFEKNFQSLFTSFSRDFFTVKVRIAKKVTRHFKIKQHLKSQRIVGKIEDDLLVEFTINDEMEIIPLVQMWMPNIQIIEPQYLQDKILDNLENYKKLSTPSE